MKFDILLYNTPSNIFAMAFRFEIGRCRATLLHIGFLGTGCTTDSFSLSGKTQVLSDKLMILVRGAFNSSIHCTNIRGGMPSGPGGLFFGIDLTTSDTSLSDI
uniref:Uncharacterized protein n=1 Tax=Cacopsylla melanoneura TaxID=428564 RepID=A0A8D8PYD5_9HEMI